MFENAFVEIDLNKITENYRAIKKFVKVTTIAVLKANAYGLGAVRIAKALQGAGCGDFAVANVREGIELRKNGIEGTILVLGHSPKNAIKTLEKFDLTQSLSGKDHSKGFYGKSVKVQLAIDSGMRRAGIDPCAADAEKTVCDVLQNCRLTGLYGHLCAADDSFFDEYTKKTTEKFVEFVRPFEKGLCVHLFNSAAALRFPIAGNAVRIGVALYGIKPFEGGDLPIELKPAVNWKSAVCSVRSVKAGESVGYGRSFVAKKDATIATVSCGYADGFSRALSNSGEVLIKGKRARVAGRVCMDCFTVDATDIVGVKEGDIVTIAGDGLPVEEHAKSLSTISHEVLSRIGARVKRRYL